MFLGEKVNNPIFFSIFKEGIDPIFLIKCSVFSSEKNSLEKYGEFAPTNSTIMRMNRTINVTIAKENSGFNCCVPKNNASKKRNKTIASFSWSVAFQEVLLIIFLNICVIAN